MWCAGRREAESLVRCEKMPEYSLGYSRRWGEGLSRASLMWVFSGEGVAHSWITHHTHYTKAEGAFSLGSLMAQVNCITEFQIVNSFSGSARIIGGSQVMQERDQCENVTPFIDCSWFLGEIHLSWSTGSLPLIFDIFLLCILTAQKKTATIDCNY